MANTFELCQPAQSAQVDIVQDFLPMQKAPFFTEPGLYDL